MLDRSKCSVTWARFHQTSGTETKVEMDKLRKWLVLKKKKFVEREQMMMLVRYSFLSSIFHLILCQHFSKRNIIKWRMNDSMPDHSWHHQSLKTMFCRWNQLIQQHPHLHLRQLLPRIQPKAERTLLMSRCAIHTLHSDQINIRHWRQKC